MLFVVFMDAWALMWLFLYAHWFSKLRLNESSAQSGANLFPRAEVGSTRIEGDVMHRAACWGLKRVATTLLLTLGALVGWLLEKRPLSTWELLLLDENILICLLLAILMARLERIRRLYRPSEQPAEVAAR
jgi:hypothetical protein